MTESPDSLQSQVVQELTRLVEPLATLRDPEAVRTLLASLGWEMPANALPTLGDLVQSFDTAGATIEAVHAARSTGDVSALLAAGPKLRAIFDVIAHMKDGLPTGIDFYDSSGIKDEGTMFVRLSDYLLVTYLQRYHPRVYAFLVLTGLIRRFTPTPLPPYHHSAGYNVVSWSGIPLLFSAPSDYIAEAYLWGTDDFTTPTQPSGGFDERRFFTNLLIFMRAFGASGGEYLAPDNAVELRYPLLKAGRWNEIYQEFGLALRPLVAQAPQQRGLAILPYTVGSLAATVDLDPRWQLSLRGAWQTTAQGLRLELRPSEAALLTGLTPEAVDITLGLQFTQRPNSGTAKTDIFLLGATDSPFFLRLRGIAADIEVRPSQSGWLQVQLDLGELAINLSPRALDGFLAKMLPSEGLNATASLGLTVANGQPIRFTGRGGLDLVYPVNKTLGGVVSIESLYLSLHGSAQGIDAVIAATAKLALGPFVASVDRVGLLARLLFPRESSPNIAIGFKPPDGAGLVLDAEAIVGGGYLLFDPKNEQYAGILQLEVKGGIALKAIGLLSTRMPDGSKGFSLLIIITAEFPPIQLGYGFTLSGVGGLIGVHRTMVIDVLRAGIKNRTLDSILFPKNPVENATKIISDLRGVFPVASGRFVFGPMAILGWGVPTILTLELGILIELPAPVRVALLGTLTMILPEEKAPAVVIHMDVLGVLDFDKGEVSIDATLYDSRIAVFALTGDMALRASWGASPTFALSAGGFNPRFQPPPAFPALDRLALTLATGDNPRLRLEAYLALTSNTAQLGARVDLYAEFKVGVDLGVAEIEKTISVQAYLGFDTLIQFSPFGLIAELGAQAVGKVDGIPIVQIALNLTLTGPQPWHAWGEATFTFLEMDWRFPFDMTFGSALDQSAPAPPDPLERLRVALADQRNWSAQLPGSGHMLVTLRQMEVGQAEILVHPLGDLTVRQREVPLEVEIARFGSLPLPARKKYTIEKVELGAQVLQPKAEQQVRDAFAPGQFFEMSDDAKLSRPAFEALPSGYTRLGVTGTPYPSSATRTATFHYDTVVIDKKDAVVPRHEAAYALPPQLMPVLAGLGAAAESPMRQTGSARFAGPSQKVVVKEPAYAVANTTDLAVATTAMSYVEAEEAQRGLGGDGTGCQVVGAHEVEG